MSEEYPEAVNAAIGIFLFHRLFCPAIVDPALLVRESERSRVPKPSPAAQTGLIYISKILQNLATGTKFGKKESAMTPFNFLITDNQQVTASLFED